MEHPRDKQNVVLIHRWSLYTGGLYIAGLTVFNTCIYPISKIWVLIIIAYNMYKMYKVCTVHHFGWVKWRYEFIFNNYSSKRTSP